MKNRLLAICLLILLPLSLGAQTTQKYSGSMSTPKWCKELIEYMPNDLKGYYSYYENEDEERVPHGQFCLTYRTGSLNGISQYEIKGSFNHGVRDGLWTLRAKKSDGKYIPTYHYEFRYKDGSLNGPFIFRIHNDERAEISGTFTDNVMSGHITIKTHYFFGEGYSMLEGELNEKGNPHGLWKESVVMKDNKGVPAEKTRLYYDGCLVYRRVKDNSTGEIQYTYQVSEAICKPSDIEKILPLEDSTVDVGGVICTIGKASTANFNGSLIEGHGKFQDGDNYKAITREGFVRSIYPSIDKWLVKFNPVR